MSMIQRLLATACAATMSTTLTAQSASPTCLFTSVDKLTPVASGEDGYATASALDGDQAVVGAYLADLTGADVGAAYVYRDRIGEWDQTQILVAMDALSGDRFGFDVAMHEDVLVVGSPRHDSAAADAGAVYVYRWDGSQWNEEQKLTASDAAASDEFGSSVAVFGPVVVVGAWKDDDGGPQSGALYVFRWNGSTWMEEQKLVPGALTQGSRLGNSVAIDGNVVIGGAVLHAGTGAAFSYRWNGSVWILEQTLQPAGLQQGDQYGQSVDVEADLAVIGAWMDDEVESDVGAAYVYRHDGLQWQQQSKLLPTASVVGGNMGQDVAVSSGLVAIGGEGVFGTALLYRDSGAGWFQLQTFWPSGRVDFGSTLAMDRGSLLVGDRNRNTTFYTAGCNDVNFRFSRQTLSSNAPSCGCGSLDASGDVVVFSMGLMAEVHRRVGGSFIYQQDLPEIVSSNGFGVDVSVSPPIAVVGANQSQSNKGSAHVYRDDGNNWNGEQLLLASDGAASDFFGVSVSADGSRLAVGASGHAHAGLKTGAVYVFEFNGVQWVEQTELRPSNGIGGELFGAQVELWNDVIAVGAPGAEAGNGRVYVFREVGGTWTEEALIGPGQPGFSNFGRLVSLSGPVLAAAGFGGPHVYRWNGVTWLDEAVSYSALFPAMTAASLDVDGDFLMVGAGTAAYPIAGTEMVSGYMWDGTQWSGRWLWLAEDPSDNVGIGDQGVAVLDQQFLATALGGSSAPGSTGRVLVFEPELTLASNAQVVEAGESLTIQLVDGAPGLPGMVAAVDVNGISGFWPLLTGPFATSGSLKLASTVPAGLDGVEIRLLGLGFDLFGDLSLSGTVDLRFRSVGPR